MGKGRVREGRWEGVEREEGGGKLNKKQGGREVSKRGEMERTGEERGRRRGKTEG